MNKKRLVPVVLALLVIFVLPLAVYAATTIRFTERYTFASFFEEDECGSRSIYISTNESIDKKIKQTAVDVSISIANNCTNEYVNDTGRIYLSDPTAFTIDKLNSAHLATTVSVGDRNVQIDLTWTGTGEVNSSHYKQKETIGKCTLLHDFRGTYRFADVSGSVSDETTDYVLGASSFGEIGQSKQGQLIINCEE